MLHCEGRLVLVLTLALTLAHGSGCGDDARAPAGAAGPSSLARPRGRFDRSQTAASSVRGPVVAHVDGEPIGLAEVQQLCSATGLPPDQALRRLVSERLLVRHASREGYGGLAVVERAARQAQVRALLARTVEAPQAPTTPGSRAEDPAPAATVAEQKERLDRLLTQLAQQVGVKYDEVAIQQAFKPDSR